MGGVLALLLSSPGAQSSEGSLQDESSSVEPLGVQPLPTWGAFPFIVQGGAPIYIYLTLCLGSVWESFVLVSRRGPLGRSGVGRLASGWFSWATDCPSAVPSRISRDGLVTRMAARGSSPVLSAWANAPYQEGYLMPSLRSPYPQDSASGEGCLTKARRGSSGHARWRNGVVRRGDHHYAAGGDVR